MPRKILVAVAWPYVNGPPHLGHIAGMNVPADIFVRYHRLAGNDAIMVSGSDMHGTPTALRAADEGVEPDVIAQRYHKVWSDCLAAMGFSYDIYTDTDTDNHREVTHDLFLRLHESGFLYEADQTMPYSVTEERFLSDRFVEGTCPHCDNPRARGDQCDACGRTLDPSDLIDIRSARDGSTPEFRDTTHHFFKLSAFQDGLEEWVSAKSEWRANVRNQTMGWLHEGLIDRAITRDIDWGVPVPFAGYEDKRIYVWFEAVIGYLSATKEWAKRSGQPDAWKRFWEEPDAETYYFQGKDNIPFHTLIWPAMLMGYGGFNLPTDVAANEYLNFKGQEFSKSRNWAVWLPDYLERYEVDPLRYYLAATMPETSDSDFTWEGFVAANNNELVATFGNFVHRVLTLTYRNFDGAIPEPGALSEDDEAALAACDSAIYDVAVAIEARRFRDALRAAMGLAQHGNRYVDQKAPWAQVREDKSAAATTLWTTLNIVTTLRTVMNPFLPFSTQRIHEMIGCEGEVGDVGWARQQVIPNTPLSKPTPLFRKLDESVVEEEYARLDAS